MTVDLIQIITLFLVLLGLHHYFVRNDEFILILVAFFVVTGIMRYNAVVSGQSKWVEVKYAYDIFDLNDDLALTALTYFFLGTLIFSVSYYINYPKVLFVKQKLDNQQLFDDFLQSKQLQIIVLFVIFLVINTIFNKILSGYGSYAYGLSYFFLFKLAIGGIILLIFLVLKSLKNQSFERRLFYLAILLFAAYSSYDPTTRFQFLSWMIALGFLVVKDISPLTKAKFYVFFGPLIIVVFSYMGNMRLPEIRNKDFSTKLEYAIRRIKIAEDFNMLDGFMMVLQVYPQYLDYSLGMEHFEILLRPIPRALWPDKPVGGYANKLKLNEGMPGGTTVGISQSIYGSFYGEGGVIGIILFSFMYGLMFVFFFKQANKYDSDMKYLLRGLLYASIIPILRGGDLPGIVAFIGMSYWPVFLFLYQYKLFLRRKQIENSAVQ